jgi:hypothetical protein
MDPHGQARGILRRRIKGILSKKVDLNKVIYR